MLSPELVNDTTQCTTGAVYRSRRRTVWSLHMHFRLLSSTYRDAYAVIGVLSGLVIMSILSTVIIAWVLL